MNNISRDLLRRMDETIKRLDNIKKFQNDLFNKLVYLHTLQKSN